MKEYYLDFRSQKRRLRFYHGDAIICFNEEIDAHNVYRVVHEPNHTYSLYCFSCHRLVCSGYSKEQLKAMLLEHFNVKRVIAKHELVSQLEQHLAVKLLRD